MAASAAPAFIGFGFWTLHGGDTLPDEEQQKAGRAAKSAVIAGGTAFFLAELGDKTMLATITLATTTAGSAPGWGPPWAWSPPTPCSSSSVPG